MNIFQDKETIPNILFTHNVNNKVRMKKIDWDHFIFNKMVVKTTFIGELHTRKANKEHVTSEKIFLEHLHDFEE